MSRTKFEDDRKYICRGKKDNSSTIDMFINAGAEYDESLNYREGYGANHYYVNDDNKISVVSIFDEDYEIIKAEHPRLGVGGTDDDFKISDEDWKHFLEQTYIDFIDRPSYVYDALSMEPEPKFSIGKFKFHDEQTYADHSKLTELSEYAFNGNADFLPKKDISGEYARGTVCEGSIVVNDEEAYTSMLFLFVNGNNGNTVVSSESVLPIMKFIEKVESLGGKAFISCTGYHSDVYYYTVTVILRNQVPVEEDTTDANVETE